MNKAIITVVGKDRVGIIAGVCTYLAENQINILDITQTIVKGFFNMMMVVDVENITKSFGEVAQELEQVGEEIGVSVKIQGRNFPEDAPYLTASPEDKAGL